MRLEVVLIIVLMALVTYATRGLPLVIDRFSRLPPRMSRWLGLVAPATLGGLAGTSSLLVQQPEGPSLLVGPSTIGVIAAIVVMYRRRSLPLAIGTAIALTAMLRWFAAIELNGGLQ
jgi:branched-subunit amino acid transport protein